MPDRATNFGESEADTDFQMRQDGDDWVLEHLPTNTTFEYDATTDQWQLPVQFVTDTATDPTTNGELRRNGTDLKAYSGGDVRNLSNIGGGGGLTTTTVDDTDSPYLTQDEERIYVDTSGGAVTITLASADATLGNEIEIVNISGANAVTVETEGGETIDPDGEATKTISAAGWAVGFVSDGTNWDGSLAGELDSLDVGSVNAGQVNDSAGTATLGESVASGSVTLSSGSATVDTNISESTTATFYVALGPDTDDSEVAASIDANSGGNYTVHIDEINTSVGNPTVRYDIVRVR